MKKSLCFLVTLLLVVALVGLASAASVSASYDNGVVTIYASGLDENVTCWLDGELVGGFRNVEEGTVVKTKSLPTGQHTVQLGSSLRGVIVATTYFYVGEQPTAEPTAEPTVTPTQAPTAEPTTEPTEAPASLVVSASYAGGVISVTASNVTSKCEVWLDDVFQGTSVTADGTYTINKWLNPGTYTIGLRESATGKVVYATLKVNADNVDYSASYTEVGKLTLDVSGLNQRCELWLDGSFSGKSVTSNGTSTYAITLAEGNHTVQLRNSATGAVYAVKSFTVSHIWDDGKVTTPATCEEAGVTTYTCKIDASHTKTEAIPATGHTPEVLPAVEPTCTETGLTEGSKCSVCGKVLTEQKVVPAKGHTVEVIPGKAATCTEDGLTDGEKCTVCGEILKAQEVIPATGHTVEVIPGKEATCEEDGLTDGEKCSVCGEILKAQEVIPAKGHTPEVVPGKEATCEEAGLTDGEKCSVCDKVLKEQSEIPALGHKWVSTTMADGSKKWTCSRCGTWYIEAGDQPQVVLPYGNILINTKNLYVDYTAEPSKDDAKNLVITRDDHLPLDQQTSEVGLYLSKQLVEDLKKDGFETVTYVNGNASITFALADLSDDWFETDKAIASYVISLDPEVKADNGAPAVLVKVEALVGANEKVAANSFAAMTLNVNGTEGEVTENGAYAAAE